MKKLSSTLAFALIALLALAGDLNNPYAKMIYFRMPDNIQQDDYKAKTVLVKFKEQYRAQCHESGAEIPELAAYLSQIGATTPKKMFPGKQKPERERNPQGLKYADLSLIYEINYSAEVSLEKVINKLYYTGLVEYSEPYYIPKLCYIPNDPFLGNQTNFLNQIGAYVAWNTQKGDTSVVIGITDTGIDTNHPDLVNAIKYNYLDPINGTDDDGDGYTDNWRGWDVAMNDNNPQWQANQHGVHVSGDASADTDNGTGVAASGFNTKLLPVKISDGGGSLIAAYQGITYAADHGADIINCSWGGGGYSQTSQDVITYATINKDALVIAAAGNNGVDEKFYPSSYEYVIRVAATNNGSDVKAGFSSYGCDVDVCAPGSSIYSTTNNSYGNMSGTSMASPVAAGAAAIIKSEYPGFTALQVGEQLRVSCDNIDGVNPSYAEKLGMGRINMGTSVAGITGPSVVMSNMVITDNNDNTFLIGDTVDIYGDYTNYLANSSNLTATLTTTSPFVNMIDGVYSIGVLNTLQTTNNNADHFQFEILPGCPLNEQVDFKLTFDDGSYSAFICISVVCNVDYINIAINEVATTITSKGMIGWNNQPSLDQGLGFQFLSQQMMYEGGVMIGNSSTRVSDYLRSNPSGTFDTDFQPVINVAKIPNLISEFDVEGWFDDSNGGNPLDVQVHHTAYAWTLPGHTRYVIVEYTIQNTGGSTLNNVYAGIFSDWDIQDYSQNDVGEDVPRKMGYCWDTQPGGKWAGISVLTNQSWNHYAVDNDGSNGSIDIYDGFTTSEKWTSINTSRATAGTGDVSDVVCAGPVSIAVGDSVTMAFALIAGDNLSDIQETRDSAWTMYNCNINPVTASTSSNDANCAQNDGDATVNASGGTSPYSYLWDPSAGNQTTATATGLIGGTYSVTVTDANGCSYATTVTVNIFTPNINANLTMNLENCGTGDGDATTNPSGGTSPYTYQWDTNTGNQTTQMATGLSSGNYFVTITDDNGCTAVDNITVTGTPAVAATTSSNPAACGNNDGDATANPTLGPSPYTYQWDANTGNQTTQTATGLSAGSYDVTVTDANNCTGVFTANVNNIGGPTLSLVQLDDLLCYGDANGAIDISVTGGVPPITYIWSNAATTEDVSGLSGGIYFVTATDANNCIYILTDTVYEPPVLDLSGNATDLVCNGDNNGTVDITVSGGTPPYLYNWSNTATTEDLSNLSGGIYTVTVTDDNACDTILSFTVVEPAILGVTGVVTDNQPLGEIDLTVTGGTSPYSYNWTGPNAFTSTQEDLLGLTDPGMYIVTVTDANSCSEVDTFIVAGMVKVNEIADKGVNIAIYPNPTDGKFNIVFTAATEDDYRLEIKNILGQIVHSELLRVNGNFTKRIDLSNLSRSVYFLSISNSGSEKTYKLIVN